MKNAQTSYAEGWNAGYYAAGDNEAFTFPTAIPADCMRSDYLEGYERGWERARESQAEDRS